MKTKRLLISLTLGLGLALASMWLLGGPHHLAQAQAGTGVIRVDGATGTDAPGCGSAASPCRTVQYAVDQAQPGEEIRVATGVYTGVQGRPVPAGYPNPPASNLITQVVYISKTVTIRGGYTTTNWTTPNPVSYPTTLDAQGLGRVMVIAGEISPTVEGLRLTGGDAAGLGGSPSAGWNEGGGMYIINATAAISNNRVFSNTNIANGDGGGLYLWESPSTLSGNTVSSNTADFGGGLFLYRSAAALSGNTVSANTAANNGGGLHLYASTATLTDNTISYNTADHRGGGLRLYYSAATLSDNTIYSNTADFGGGLYLWESAAMLSGNTVSYNTADFGGGLLLDHSAATLSGNTVSYNTAYRGGGLYLYESPSTLTNTVVTDNRANTAGSGLYIHDHSSPRLLHTTIARNTAGDCSGVRLLNSPVVLTNTILVRHTVGITVAANSTVTLEATLWATGTAWANVNNTGGGGTINT
ncbi:MAG: hypothetical protein DRI79_07880, partial [Chloroflexi bacterium]